VWASWESGSHGKVFVPWVLGSGKGKLLRQGKIALRMSLDMRHLVHQLAAMLLLAVMAASLVALPASGADQTVYPKSQATLIEKWEQPLSERQKAELLLSRITFGARPGDVGRALQMGINNFLDQQLHPRTIDDSSLEAKLQGLQTLRMPPAIRLGDFLEFISLGGWL
jgi:hypothetical protein